MPAIILCTYFRSFEKRDRLRIHILHVHEKHRPHACSVCGKRFSQSSSLNKVRIIFRIAHIIDIDVIMLNLCWKHTHTLSQRRTDG